jgi:hypothetical protein
VCVAAAAVPLPCERAPRTSFDFIPCVFVTVLLQLPCATEGAVWCSADSSPNTFLVFKLGEAGTAGNNGRSPWLVLVCTFYSTH